MARLIPKGGGGLPVGVPLHLPIANLPKNCVLLDGTAMPDWASSMVKTMYGATLPDYRGRTPVGTDEGSGRVGAGWAQTPGQGGGSDTHTLTESEMPSHSHGGSTDTTSNHRHPNGGADTNSAFSGGDKNYAGSGGTSYTGYAGGHAHLVSIDNTGGGNAHNIMQPGISGRWVMRLK